MLTLDNYCDPLIDINKSINTPDMNPIPTFVINLKKRTDRKEHVLKQFKGKNEFNVSVIEALEHEIGSIGLWESIKLILKENAHTDQECIIVCEDDHEFTEHYSKELLFGSINEALKHKADILCGGVSWFSNAFAVTENVFWLEGFTGFQFTIIFRHFFKKILEAEFDEHDAADFKVSSLTTNKFFIFPFISVQKEFGYSDVTSGNNTGGKVQMQFSNSLKKGYVIRSIYDYINDQNKRSAPVVPEQYDGITIPVYVVVSSGNTDSLSHISAQFKGKDEFDVAIIESCKHDPVISAWKNIRRIVELAIKNDDDLIIICEEGHEFTRHYTRESFLENVVEAYYQRVELISGGIIDFDIAIPVTENRFWINIFSSTEFLVLNRSIFKKILDHDPDDMSYPDTIFSRLTNSKMTIFPFISSERRVGSNWRIGFQNETERSEKPTMPAEDRLRVAWHMHNRYCKNIQGKI